MKKKGHTLLKFLENVVCAVAVISVYVGHPHCLLIIHQPKVPEELKHIGSGAFHENFDL